MLAEIDVLFSAIRKMPLNCTSQETVLQTQIDCEKKNQGKFRDLGLEWRVNAKPAGEDVS